MTKSKYLTRGRLIPTKEVMRWTQEERDQTQRQEHCMAFKGDWGQEGKDRTFVCSFNSPKDCSEFIKHYNGMVYALSACNQHKKRKGQK